MSEHTTISWTDSTFSPWHGCQKVSPACQHCYAERNSHRFGHDVWGPNAPRQHMSDRYWQEPIKWNRKAEREGRQIRVFCGSMCDILEDREDLLAPRVRLWELIERTPHLTWLLLTKRPERYRVATPQRWWEPGQWPRNAWAGTTVENQEWADRRIPHLLQIPAPVRFISAEPLLGEVELPTCGKIHWTIVGSESGPQRRPTDIRWVRSIRDQCQALKSSFFLKQLDMGGGLVSLPALDGRQWDEIPEAAR